MQVTADGKKWTVNERSQFKMSFLESIQTLKAKLKPTKIRTTYPDGTQTVSSVIDGAAAEEALATIACGFVIDTHPDTIPACILNDFLYLGSQDAVSLSNIDAYRFTDILSIGIPLPESSIALEDGSRPPISSTFIECLDLPETNLQPVIAQAVRIINVVRSENRRILVHCNAGVSRSASICIAYVMLAEGLEFSEAFAMVKSKRACIQPNLGFIAQLKQIRRRWSVSSQE